MNQLYLCFYADGPLWDNVIHIPAFPRGFSYLRPFRYRDAWIQPSLLKEIENRDKRTFLIGEKAIICMRFLDNNYKWYLLPVREAELTKVDYAPGNHSVYFRLGAYFNFGSVQDLRAACLELPPAEHDSVANHIFFRSGVQFPDSSFSDQINEEKVWTNYCDLIARDNSLTINNNARKALFLRFEVPATEIPAPVSPVYTSHNMGKIYGSVLSEGETYELVISHRIPALIARNISTKPITMEFKSPTSNFEISPSGEDVTGNYQKHILTLSAKKPSKAWEEIIISPPKEAEAQDGSKILTIKLSIPVKIRASFWFRLKTLYIWLFLLWLSLFISVFLDKYLGIEENQSNAFLILGTAITTLISSIMIFILQQKNVSVK